MSHKINISKKTYKYGFLLAFQKVNKLVPTVLF